MNNYVGQCESREHSSGSMVLARGEALWRLVGIIAALHVGVFSFALGPRCNAYVGAAYLSAVVVWGGVSMHAGKRGVGFIVGAVLSLAVQQAAYRVWKAELGGFWWPLAQFFAVQVLVGVGVERGIRYALKLGAANEPHAEGRGRGPAAQRCLAKPAGEGILEVLQLDRQR